MKALIFAAGLGTRLRPVTDTIPKALVQVGGKPLLYWVVTRLKAAGVNDFVINVHHFADSIIGYVREQDGFGVNVSFSDERDFLRDTGGGISYARNLLEGGPFLVHNVDILSDLDIGWFLSQTHPDALSNILVSERKTQRYFLFDEQMRLVGWTNTATGEVRSPFGDIDPGKYRKFAFAGIHCISEDIFKVFDDEGWGDRFSITDFYIRECGRHLIRGIASPDLHLLDVGKTETLSAADDFIRNSIQNIQQYGKK